MRTTLAINLIAHHAYSMLATRLKGLRLLSTRRLRLAGCLASTALLAACTTPQPPVAKIIYDFGPVYSTAAAPATSRRPALALPEIEAGAGLDSPALLYRLQYQDAHQLRPYALARWSVPPAQLVRSRLRDALSRQGPVLATEGVAAWVLRVELDEFSQLFDSPASSQALVRLRVSLLRSDQLVAQTSLVARAAAPSQDAAGGVRALTMATDDVVSQLAAWLNSQLP